MKAELCRMVGRVFNSPYWIKLNASGGVFSQEWIIDKCVEAGTFDKLPADVQRALNMCYRSFELFQENRNSREDPDELNARIIAQVEKEYANR